MIHSFKVKEERQANDGRQRVASLFPSLYIPTPLTPKRCIIGAQKGKSFLPKVQRINLIHRVVNSKRRAVMEEMQTSMSKHSMRKTETRKTMNGKRMNLLQNQKAVMENLQAEV